MNTFLQSPATSLYRGLTVSLFRIDDFSIRIRAQPILASSVSVNSLVAERERKTVKFSLIISFPS